MKSKIINFILIITLFSSLLIPAMAEDQDDKFERIILSPNFETEENIETGYILVGDSRFVQMKYVFDIDEYDNCYIVCKSAMGLNWLKNDAIKQIYEIIEDNQDIGKWVILSNLGVNDVHNASKYLEFYDSINTENIDIILMSVNPAGENYPKMNEKIQAFNEIIKNSDYQYLDTNSALKKDGYEAPDGIHYTKETYRYIFDMIANELWGD